MTDFKELVDAARRERTAHDDRFDSFIKAGGAEMAVRRFGAATGLKVRADSAAEDAMSRGDDAKAREKGAEAERHAEAADRALEDAAAGDEADRSGSFEKEAPRGLSEHPPVTPAGIVPEGGLLPPTPETTAPITHTSNDPFDAHRRAYYDHVRQVLGSTAADDVIEGIAPYSVEWNRRDKIDDIEGQA